MGLGGRRQDGRAPADCARARSAVYAMGTFLGGSRADAPGQFGFDYEEGSGTVRIEYSVSRNLILGIAANFMATNADVTVVPRPT